MASASTLPPIFYNWLSLDCRRRHSGPPRRTAQTRTAWPVRSSSGSLRSPLCLRFWTHCLGLGLKGIVGLDIEIRGRENLGSGAAVYVSKHQSAWDAFVFYTLLDDPNYILKKELD